MSCEHLFPWFSVVPPVKCPLCGCRLESVEMEEVGVIGCREEED